MEFIWKDKIESEKDASGLIRLVIETFGAKAILGSSLSIEDQAVLHLMMEASKDARVFTLDTGRLPQETHDVIAETEKKYAMKFEYSYPESSDLAGLTAKIGANGFYQSIENRKECCRVRKIEPLKKALKGVEVWITGLRRDQSITRSALELVEFDETFKVIKVNPLAAWSEEDVWKIIRGKQIPYSALYDKGYTSIGCAPCTRAIKEGEDVRAGRWWWEEPEKKECGLHRPK